MAETAIAADAAAADTLDVIGRIDGARVAALIRLSRAPDGHRIAVVSPQDADAVIGIHDGQPFADVLDALMYHACD